VLGLMILGFAIISTDKFLSGDNLKTLLSQGAGLAIVSAGLTLVLVSWDFDLSVGAMATLAGLVVAILLDHEYSVVVAIGLTLLLGAVVGLINGLIVSRLGVSAFIATLAMLTILGGLGNWWTDSKAIPVTNLDFLSIDITKVLGIPLPAVIAIGVFVVLWILLERTKVGRMLYAVGANPNAAYIAGVRVKTLRTLAFTGSAMFAALAGILLTSKLSGGYHSAGDPYLLNAFAAVFLGAVTLRIGQFHILGTAVGILILTILANGLDTLSTPSYVTQIITGVILIAAVSLASLSRSGTKGL